MKAFKTLVIKDLIVIKKSLMIPVWYLLGSYVLMIAAWVYAVSATGSTTCITGIPLELIANNSLHQLISFGIQGAMFFGLLGFVFAISMSVTGSTMLNQDIKQKCELFHRSQPVSIWQITGARFVAGVGGQIALAFIIGLVNMILSIIVIGIATPLRLDLWMSLNGFMLSWIHFSIALMVFGSILFLLSAIFRENAAGLGIATLGGIQLITYFVNKIYGWNIPYILNLLYRMILSGVLNIQKSIPSMQQFGAASANSGFKAQDLSNFTIPHNFLASLWGSVFTWDIASKFAVCAVLYVIATYIYHKREVQF